MSSLQAKLQHKYALSEKGAKDMIKAFVSVTCSLPSIWKTKNTLLKKDFRKKISISYWMNYFNDL